LCASCVLQGEEKTTVLLPSAKVDSYTSTIKPVSVTGRAAVFGPYEQQATAEESTTVLEIHYEHDTGVPVATSVEREIEVSHYGSVAVEEFFDLRHAGALLKGSFSRLEHQYSPSPNAFQELTALLPARATGVYYRDAIGNVTSSNLRVVPSQRVDLELKFRFPLLGGWHIEWYQGYNLPLDAVVVEEESGRYTLECDALPPFKGLLSEKLVVKVVLPAGARDWKVESPSSSAVSAETRFSYLDVPFLPRPVIVLEMTNVIAEGKPTRLKISYSLPAWHLLGKPLAVFSLTFLCFCMSMVANRVRWEFAVQSEVVDVGKKKN
jgi:oligosaccharyltransferase complex subunit alpha (ribophorin I)